MDDLIDRDALLKDLRSECPESDVCFSHESCIDCIVKRQPTIEPEVRRGEWIPAKSTISSKCSACGKYSPSESPFCPRCGADMREVSEDA